MATPRLNDWLEAIANFQKQREEPTPPGFMSINEIAKLTGKTRDNLRKRILPYLLKTGQAEKLRLKKQRGELLVKLSYYKLSGKLVK